MRLIHITDKKNIKGIKQYGLLSTKKNVFTISIGEYQNMYKPKCLPDYVDMNKCIYFYNMIDGYAMSSSLGIATDKNNIREVHILSQVLDINKLYVGSRQKENIAGHINDIYIEQYINNKGIQFKRTTSSITNAIKEMSESNDYKDYLNRHKGYIRDYWDLFEPFNQYEIRRKGMTLIDKLLRHGIEHEIMYFGDIEPGMIDTITKEITKQSFIDEDREEKYSNNIYNK